MRNYSFLLRLDSRADILMVDGLCDGPVKTAEAAEEN